jgi:DNA polymerase-1
VKDTETDRLMATLPTLMAGIANLDVPLLVEAGMGDNWDQAH